MADLTDIAHQAQRDLNSYQAKQGVGHQSTSSTFSLSPFSLIKSSCSNIMILFSRRIRRQRKRHPQLPRR